MEITRFPPSPTGEMHLGNARTSYLNWLAAKASGGKWILRIDNTDLERSKDEYTKVIFDSLEWLGLEPDAVYFQSNRIKLYQKAAKELLCLGKAKEIEGGAIALLWPKNMPVSFTDTISGDIFISKTNQDQIHEKTILLRGGEKLGQPTYQFASAFDDLDLDISWIIRGHDHISNTPKQIAIWKALNPDYKIPKLTHLGLIFKDKKKLSKREHSASLLWYKEQGYSPEAMLNFMLRLGWSPKGDNKDHQFIDRNRAIELFFEGNLSNRPCNYDLAKLNSLQRHYA